MVWDSSSSAFFSGSFKLFAALLLCLFCMQALSEQKPLIFSYWNQASPPFVLTQSGTLSGGIIKDIGDLLGEEFKREVSFIKLPTKRIEPYLIDNRIDFDCITSPIWKETPDAYRWSPILFAGADRFLIRPGENNNISRFSDLRGKILGIYHDYTYHPEIMRMMKEQEVVTTPVTDLEKAVDLLLKKRIDVFIDFGIVIKHYLKTNELKESLTLASLPADTFNLHCAFRYGLDIEHSKVSQTFTKLVDDGSFQTILNQYQ